MVFVFTSKEKTLNNTFLMVNNDIQTIKKKSNNSKMKCK